jgi:peptide/nickel transport system substrate-binding protein
MTLLTRRTFGALVAASALAQRAKAEAVETLTVGIASDPVTLDPALISSYFEVSVQFNIHEPLLHLTPDLRIEPGLANFEQPDPLTYRFALRPGLVFHDGTPIDAAAAKFNFDRMLDPATGSPRRLELAPVAKVDVTGALTFTVRLDRPYVPFLQIMALRAGMMVSPSAVTALGADFATRAVGAGPYRVVNWVKNSQLVLDRFDGYWRGPAPTARIVFQPLVDETVRITNLRSGTVQLVDSVPPQMLGLIGHDPALTLKQMPGLGFHAFSFNLTRPPFSDVRLRRALIACFDQEAALRAVYFGAGTAAQGAIPPSQASFFDPTFRPYRHDPALARQLIGASAAASPVEFTITVTNSASQVRLAEILQAEAKLAGLNASIRQVDPTSLITVLRARDFDIAISPWSGRSDPDGNMFGWFTKDGPFNFAGYRNDQVGEWLEAARIETDATARARLYRLAQSQIAEDAPMLFVGFPAILQASRAALQWDQYPDGAFQLQFARFR